ncbi:MAG: sigma-54-dependent Fis family transcriptional regulator, partial [Candidatus Latescibacteria bacterium]|nr:sigma-54-dependent Fis family transcriptional regulator [Candidatus Latescibacterota bacterium]
MPKLNGMDLINKMRSSCPRTKIIMMTAFATVETAVQALRDGAFNYITKPIDFDQLLGTIESAVTENQRELQTGDAARPSTIEEPTIIGNSERIQEVYRKIDKVAKANATVLIRGESGTGKELAARAIHARSKRSDKAFMDISCGSIPEELIEAELFGTEKGAFTGALNSTRKGVFERADGGTIFLDEIGEIGGNVQVKLLRILQERRFERLGGTSSQSVDVRIVAATNRDLEMAVKDGNYREDLYYRLNVIPIVMPPLRERREDIAPLISHFAKKYSLENGMSEKIFSDEAMNRCLEYAWPGNIRELENAVESAVILSDGDTIGSDHLPQVAEMTASIGSPLKDQGTLSATKDLAEKAVIQRALEEAGGNRTKAAGILGVTVRTIHYKIKKYGL